MSHAETSPGACYIVSPPLPCPARKTQQTDMPDIDAIRQQLSTVKYPGFSRDVVSFGLVKDIRITGGEVVVQMVIATNDATVPAQIKAGAEAAIRSLPGVTGVSVRI